MNTSDRRVPLPGLRQVVANCKRRGERAVPPPGNRHADFRSDYPTRTPSANRTANNASSASVPTIGESGVHAQQPGGGLAQHESRHEDSTAVDKTV